MVVVAVNDTFKFYTKAMALDLWVNIPPMSLTNLILWAWLEHENQMGGWAFGIAVKMLLGMPGSMSECLIDANEETKAQGKENSPKVTFEPVAIFWCPNPYTPLLHAAETGKRPWCWNYFPAFWNPGKSFPLLLTQFPWTEGTCCLAEGASLHHLSAWFLGLQEVSATAADPSHFFPSWDVFILSLIQVFQF